MNHHVVQLSIGNVAIVVDDEEFLKVKKQFKKAFSFKRFLEIKDVRNRTFIIKRKHILLLEYEKEKN